MFLRYLKFHILYSAFSGVAYLRCRQYVRNPTAELTTRNLDKIADLVKLTSKQLTLAVF